MYQNKKARKQGGVKMTHTFTATKEGEDTQKMVWENKNQGDVDGTKTFWALVTAMQGQGWTVKLTSSSDKGGPI